jgi:hypothetical protein
MFDTKYYGAWLSLDIYEYQSVVWINQKRSIHSVIPVFVATTFCDTIIHLKGEVVATQNTSVDLPQKSNKKI